MAFFFSDARLCDKYHVWQAPWECELDYDKIDFHKWSQMVSDTLTFCKMCISKCALQGEGKVVLNLVVRGAPDPNQHNLEVVRQNHL